MNTLAYQEQTATWHPISARVVLCHGCFDLLHLGHIRHLQEARAMGDQLVVSVTADAHVGKGIGRPHFTAKQRVEALRALACVDDAFVNESGDAVAAIEKIRPAVYVKGADYAGQSDDLALRKEIAAVEAVGGRFALTKSEKWSSTQILKRETLPNATLCYLEYAKDKGFLEKISAAFAKADQMHIAFIGETIIDEYRYVRGIGKPAKENCLAVLELNHELFQGGVAAAAKHADWRNVSVITAEQEIHKTRYVDADFSRKLFEVYQPQALSFTVPGRERVAQRISRAVRASDCVVVLDFGHGMIDNDSRRILYGAKFLAVNAQSNAGNLGFNPVTKYRCADLICVDEPEARLAIHEQFVRPTALITDLAKMSYCDNIIVTHGHEPTSTYDGHRVAKVPAIAVNGIDRMGAGDAFISVAAPLIAAGLELEAAALAGNVAGAIKCSILGHRRAVGRTEIMQTVEALLA